MDLHHFFTDEEMMANRQRVRAAWYKAKYGKKDEKNKSSEKQSENSNKTSQRKDKDMQDVENAPKKQKL